MLPRWQRCRMNPRADGNQARVIETERLELRPLTPADADATYALWTDPDVRHYLFDDEIIPREVVADEIATSQRLMAEHGYGLWMMRLRNTDAIIGFCGYRYFHEPPQLQLLYGVAPAHWGQGLATEAACAVIRYGFEVSGFERIVASSDAPNLASQRVMVRAGMVFLKRDTFNGLDTVYYEVTHSS
jgi:ribosomal-protein-alanine N-acetyltransferase